MDDCPATSPTIRFFAHISDTLGRRTLALNELDLPVSAATTIGDIRQALTDHFPALATSWSCCRFADADHFLNDNDALPESGDIAVIPPVSGG